MLRPSPTASRSGAWDELVDAGRAGGSEQKLLEELLEILAGELGASAVHLVVDDADRRFSGPGAPAGEATGAGAEALTVPVQGGHVRFEGLPAGAAARLDGPRLTALNAAVRAVEQAELAKRQRFEVNYRGVALDALYDVGLAIAATLNLEELSEEILLRAVSLLDARRGAFFRACGDDEFQLEKTFGGRAAERLSADQFEGALAGRSSTGVEILPGSEHLLAVPVRSEKEVKGLLVVGDKESRAGVGPFGSPDRRTLELFANQAAIALENAHLHRQALEKERLEREGELAAEIQKQLLPEKPPEIDGFELTGWSRSARMVGGDYYNYIRCGDGKFFLVVADVTGKGMPAALLVSTLDSALRLLLQQGLRGAELLSALNRHVFASSASNTFITLAAVELDSTRGSCRYLSAGHNPSLWQDDATRELGASGLPLGLFEDATYGFEDLVLERGDLLCLYSDGITECLSAEGEEFGVDRLAAALAERRGRPLPETADWIGERMIEFEAGGPRGDDQTVLLLRRR